MDLNKERDFEREKENLGSCRKCVKDSNAMDELNSQAAPTLLGVIAAISHGTTEQVLEF